MKDNTLVTVIRDKRTVKVPKASVAWLEKQGWEVREPEPMPKEIIQKTTPKQEIKEAEKPVPKKRGPKKKTDN